MHIRLAQESDLPKLIAVSQTADSAAHWTSQQWLDIFRSPAPPRLAWVAEDLWAGEAKTLGFLVAQDGGLEWELENVAVLPDVRRQGVGRSLLAALLSQAASRKAERILLEVRASNDPAIRLYNANGFQLLSRRREYYRDPTEDALILVHPF